MLSVRTVLSLAVMALDRQDCLELIREIEGLLREYDPGSLELVLRATERFADPQRYLLEVMGTLRRIYSERSGGMQAPILDRINHFVRLEDGAPIRGLTVVLSSVERELYDREEINLAELPDRSNFLEELERITTEIKRETESPEERR
jgi:hypothetical protein